MPHRSSPKRTPKQRLLFLKQPLDRRVTMPWRDRKGLTTQLRNRDCVSKKLERRKRESEASKREAMVTLRISQPDRLTLSQQALMKLLELLESLPQVSLQLEYF